MPYTVAARLAAKLGCDLQAPVPIRGTQALYDEIARHLASVWRVHRHGRRRGRQRELERQLQRTQVLGSAFGAVADTGARRAAGRGTEGADVVQRAGEGLSAPAHPAAVLRPGRRRLLARQLCRSGDAHVDRAGLIEAGAPSTP
jgi:hypothetical protein